METRKCVQCGKEFTLSDSEIDFYKSKNLTLPKRCQECRKSNKKQRYNKKRPARQESSQYENGSQTQQASNQYQSQASNHQTPTSRPAGQQSGGQRPGGPQNWKLIGIVILLILLAALYFGGRGLLASDTEEADQITTLQTVDEEESGQETTLPVVESDDENSNSDSNGVAYQFKSEELLEEHFEKHGGDFDYATPQEYEAGASAVVNSPDAMHKTEKEDGDDVYYLEDTNEFVIVSKRGYIRTYFKPGDGLDYFNRQ